MKSNDLSSFYFCRRSSGSYIVSYTTQRGDYYVATIYDMPLIDKTLNAEISKVKDIKSLRDVVKSTGIHYHSYGVPF